MRRRQRMSHSKERVSRKSVAAFIVKIIAPSEVCSRSNMAVNKRKTDGDKSAFL